MFVSVGCAPVEMNGADGDESSLKPRHSLLWSVSSKAVHAKNRSVEKL
jgi:hypothetical protein